ncbi:hypothetical protein BKG94_09760 [Rodentibacter ratti]|uniref:Slam-dependent surface lipoprotein n=1 Tax=Rodentibacter ratti TaxID=1906745 RepID=UPI000986D9F6|nr:Slam-dependent surface lipoprotein [Rodentibacter ratti]OOF86568.1 hypothetical protein BKG94_09760 [Rodentibacter ratti]
MTFTKNTLIKLSLTTFAALMISACGSSGSGSDNPQPQNNNAANNTQTNQATNNKPNNNQTSTPSSSDSTGGALVISGADHNVSVKKVDLKSQKDNLTRINVDGKTLFIGFKNGGISSRGWTTLNSNSVSDNGERFDLNGVLEVCCGKYTDVRFGAIGSQEASQNDIFFYNGNPSKTIPTSGIVAYRGDSILSADSDKLPDDADYFTGTSNFRADFGAKKLTGSLDIKNVKVNIDANISGNGFSGTAKSDAFVAQGTAEGKFYGNNAKELGGLVKGNDNSWGAAFGAAKQ